MSSADAGYRQAQLFEQDHVLIASKTEDHWFDRKSFRIAPESLANLMVGFANADGGTILVGVEKDGQILGVDDDADHLNGLRQAALNFTSPPVRHATSLIPCMGEHDEPVHVSAIEVHPGSVVHRNHRDEAFLRVGDQNRKLSFDATQEILYDKGQTVFDGLIVPEATLADLDKWRVENFKNLVGGTADSNRALRARGLIAEHDDTLAPTFAAVLLFSAHPEQFLPGAHIRLLRYDGTNVRLGTRSNLTLDVRVDGPLPDQIATVETELQRHLRNLTRLDSDTGRFETVPELPRFAWLEAVVNAVTHRSYSHQGDHIRVKLFDDRLEVESPGRLPGSVRIDNIRYTRFSRNPRISRGLNDLKLVQELNEGVNRMFEEMALAGLPEPILTQTDSGFKVTLYSTVQSSPVGVETEDRFQAVRATLPVSFVPVFDALLKDGWMTTAQAIQLSGMSPPTARRYLRVIADAGIIERVASSDRDPGAFWRLVRRQA